jgi:hypothetical protein
MSSSNIESQTTGQVLPASNAVVITPSDTVDLDTILRGLYVGVTGNVNVLLAKDSSPVVLVAVPAGSLLPLRVKRVFATSTTATNLVGVY